MTPTTNEPRSLRSCAATLRYYRRHRAAHPLPEGWYEDASGLEDAAEDVAQELEPIPYLAFDGPRRQGELSIGVDLFHPTTAVVGVTDIGREVLTPEEVVDLLYTLLGIDIAPVELGEPSLIQGVEYRRSAGSESGAIPDDAEPVITELPFSGRSWSLSVPFPYLPDDHC